MVKGNSKIKRVKKRITEELIATKKIVGHGGIKAGIISLRAKLLINKINKGKKSETEKNIKLLKKKHQVVSDYIYNQFSEFLSQYDFDKKIDDETNMENTMWICWWQGIEDAPEIVKKCVKSIEQNVKSYKIVIITDENYKDYVKMPEWLEEKKESGVISKTHFSDILRFKLLAEHGGVWLDSTFYCSSKRIEKIISSKIWTIKRPGYGHLSPAEGMFANYSFGCNYKNRNFFNAVYEFLIEYWKNNDYVIDYLLTDYVINMIIDNDKEYKSLFDSVLNNNPCCDDLFKILTAPYDANVWNDLKKDTYLFKLSWKHNCINLVNGKKTFYGKIIDEKL